MLIVTVAATTEPVTLDEAKAQLRVTHSSDDDLIGALITAAREVVEMDTGRALADATYRWVSNDAIALRNRLPLWPVASVSEVSYEDASGTRQTMTAYTLDADRATVALVPPCGGSALSVTFAVTPTNVPEALKQAIKLLVTDTYEVAGATITGETVAKNPALDRLLHPYRLTLGV